MLLFSYFLSRSIHATSVVYLAGNPNAYPFEYYDAEKQEYRGILPEFYEAFSKESNYHLVYLDPGVKDNRKEMFKNKQVEVVSGIQPTDKTWEDIERVTVFESNDASIALTYSSIADVELKQALDSYFEGIDQSVWLEKFVKYSVNQPKDSHSSLFILGLGGILIVMIVVLFVKNKKTRHEMDQIYELDPITKIGNRSFLEHYAHQYINDKNRILYHLFYFQVNTEAIRQASNEDECNDVLRYVAMILKNYTKETDLLARISDNGFVLYRLSYGNQDIEEWIVSVIKRMNHYAIEFNKSFDCRVHAGIYPVSVMDKDLDLLIFKAKQTCMYAIQQDKDYLISTSLIQKQMDEEMMLKKRIVQGMQFHEFELYLQFFVDIAKNEIVGAEALTRWNHPTVGMVYPGRYLPLIQKEEQHEAFDYYVLEQVCDFLDRCTKNHLNFFVSVNFNRRTFNAVDFVERCQSIIQKYDFPVEELIFELVENRDFSEGERIYENAMKMQAFGVRLALDDFGIGFEMYKDLNGLTFDGLKIDQQLVKDSETSKGQLILKSIVDLSHQLNMTVLAEGVETKEEVERMKALNIRIIQGFYFYHPLPVFEALAILLQ